MVHHRLVSSRLVSEFSIREERWGDETPHVNRSGGPHAEKFNPNARPAASDGFRVVLASGAPSGEKHGRVHGCEDENEMEETVRILDWSSSSSACVVDVVVAIGVVVVRGSLFVVERLGETGVDFVARIHVPKVALTRAYRGVHDGTQRERRRDRVRGLSELFVGVDEGLRSTGIRRRL